MHQTTEPLGSSGAARSTELAKTHPTGQRPARYWLAAATRHGLLIVVSVIFIVPFYWMLITALKTQTTVFAVPIQWWPSTLH
jgi:ABC-type glycerol-3-phosphate transport system permease component